MPETDTPDAAAIRARLDEILRQLPGLLRGQRPLMYAERGPLLDALTPEVQAIVAEAREAAGHVDHTAIIRACAETAEARPDLGIRPTTATTTFVHEVLVRLRQRAPAPRPATETEGDNA